MSLKLIVIRSAQMEAMATFYTDLGFDPEYHCHGNSPMHYSFTTAGTVVEIYPLAKSQVETDRFLRLGFEIQNFDEVIGSLRAKGIKFHSEPQQTEFGYIVVVEDPEERKVELYKR